jgi:hypothetical protein
MFAGAFVKEEVDVTGSYALDPASGALVFSDDFGVVTGPDLFVVLSGASDLTVDFHVFSDMVVNSAKLTLGPLARTNGAQTYAVPAGTDLAQFNTVVIWCESFSVAFAAAPLSPGGWGDERAGRVGSLGGAGRGLVAAGLALPAPEERQHLLARPGGQCRLGQFASHRNRLAHLRQVVCATLAERQVLFKAGALGGRQTALQVVRHQFDQLLAGERRLRHGFAVRAAWAACSSPVV